VGGGGQDMAGILLIDDADHIRTLLRELFEDAGYDVTEPQGSAFTGRLDLLSRAQTLGAVRTRQKPFAPAVIYPVCGK
jgi:CheY-like chemotaxis protein